MSACLTASQSKVWCTKGLRNYFNVFLLGDGRALWRLLESCELGLRENRLCGKGRWEGGPACELPAWQSSSHVALAPFISHHSVIWCGLITRVRIAYGVNPIRLNRVNSKSPPHSPFLPSPSFCGGEDSTGGGQEGASSGDAKAERTHRHA